VNFISKFIQKINSIPRIYNDFGVDGLLFSTLRILGFKIKYQSIIDNKKKKPFLENLYNNFNVEILKNSLRDPFKHSLIDELSDDDRWLLMSEGRERNMNWLVCTPKNI
jgi:hypothetical protein